MLLGERLRPRFPWQKYNSFHILIHEKAMKKL